MHGFAGQLDLRRISGLRKMKGWKIVSYTMLIGCLCLAGFPLTSGYFSKDAILAQAFITPGPGFRVLGWLAIFTAGLTAYYTFRVWFRVCCGPVHYEAGDELHGEPSSSFHPHPPRFIINFVLVVIAGGALLAAVPYFMATETEGLTGGWIADVMHDSPAASHGAHDVGESVAHSQILGMDPHTAMYFISAIVGMIGIGFALYFHLYRRAAADAMRSRLLASRTTRWLPTAMENKWYVDEIYIATIRSPLWILGKTFSLIDRYLVDGLLVNGTAALPRLVARWFAPLHNGAIQSYGVSMIGGAILVVLLMFFMPEIVEFMQSMTSQTTSGAEQVLVTGTGGLQ
jgi:NADH-quinone oxidoreductase subunit L